MPEGLGGWLCGGGPVRLVAWAQTRTQEVVGGEADLHPRVVVDNVSDGRFASPRALVSTTGVLGSASLALVQHWLRSTCS